MAGIPMIFGDLLISETNNPRPHTIDLPTVIASRIDEVLAREEGYPAVAGLARKVVKVNNQFVIAWTGTRAAAEAVIKEILEMFSDRTPSIQELFEYFTTVDIGSAVDLTVIGWLAHAGNLHPFRWDFNTSTGSFDEESYTAGSGADPVSQIQRFTAVRGNLSIAEQAIGAALGLTTTIIGDEVFTGDSIYALYGGFIEFMYFENGSFMYPSKISYMFWMVLYRSEFAQVCRIVPHIIESWYVADELIVRATRFDINENNWTMNGNSGLYIIAPLTKGSFINDTQSLQDSDFSTSRYANYVFTVMNDGRPGPRCFVMINPENPNQKDLILPSRNEDNNFITFDANLLPFIRDHVAFAFKNDPSLTTTIPDDSDTKL